MACLDELNQQPSKKWIGISRATGENRTFETLGQFRQYQDALGCRPIRPSPYVQPIDTQNTIPTGFLEFKPRDAKTQARFDPMSDHWEGANASEEAVKKGVFIEDSAEPASTRERKAQPVKAEPPKTTNDLCILQ